MLTARLSKDGSRVLCHIVDCGCEIAWVLERGVYVDGRWQRAIWFPPGWAPRPDGVWAFTKRAAKRERKGQLPTLHRQPSRRPWKDGHEPLVSFSPAWSDDNGPTGFLPCNLPVEAKCPNRKCGFRQTLDPDVLRVNPNSPPSTPGLSAHPRKLYLKEELERWEQAEVIRQKKFALP